MGICKSLFLVLQTVLYGRWRCFTFLNGVRAHTCRSKCLSWFGFQVWWAVKWQSVEERRGSGQCPSTRNTLCVVMCCGDRCEAVWTAFIVKELLKGILPAISMVPHILHPAECVPSGTQVMLVMCSNGCFQVRFPAQLSYKPSATWSWSVVLATGFPCECFTDYVTYPFYFS